MGRLGSASSDAPSYWPLAKAAKLGESRFNVDLLPQPELLQHAAEPRWIDSELGSSSVSPASRLQPVM
jgi:hypothetical protein